MTQLTQEQVNAILDEAKTNADTMAGIIRGVDIVRELAAIPAVKLARGKHEYPVAWSRLTPQIIAKLAAHGLKQKMQDSATSGGKDTTEAVYKSQAEGVLTTLYSGQWGEKAEAMDPVTRLVYNMARGAALSAFKTQHSRDPDHKNKSDMQWMSSKTDEVIKKNPQLLEQAKNLLAIQIQL